MYRNNQIIRRQQINGLGHITREDSLQRTITEGKLEKEKTRERPRMMYIELDDERRLPQDLRERF